MQGLVRIYGRGLSGLVLALAAFWIVVMIVVPQAAMLHTSLWWTERSGEAAAASLRIDRLYNEVAILELDLAAAGEAEKPAIARTIEARRAEIAALEAGEVGARTVYGLANYTRMSGLHLAVFLRTILYSVLVTLLSLVVCYPIAFVAAQRVSGRRAALVLLGLVVPYAINELLRIYAWLMILDYQGVVNALLDALGLVDLAAGGGVPFLRSPAAVFAAMVYAYVLFMVFPIYNTLETLDRNQLEAARDLGASTFLMHRRVAIPHARPGIAVGCIMTFMLSAGSYSVPQIMTRGQGGDWFSQLVYRQFFEANNWNIGAAYAFSLLIVCILFIFLVMRLMRVGIREIAR
jgi:spermidine/putrescine transport system permease protein